MLHRGRFVALLAGSLAFACADGPPSSPYDPPPEVLGRCRQFDPQRLAFFGDLHVHTSLSLDANLQGNRVAVADAYRFARGEAIGVQPHDAAGAPLRTIQLERPLDFVALTDHAEFLGVVEGCTQPDAPEYDTPACQGYRDDPDQAFLGLNAYLTQQPGSASTPPPCADAAGGCPDSATAAWDEIRTAAEQAYDRSDDCSFTSFVAYEWSGSPGALNLHRNVIFRNHHVPARPAGYFDVGREEQLWQRLRDDCLARGDDCDVLTIPHNSNLSSGLMFETIDGSGAPFDAAYARTRAELEPLVEVFQHKGASECLPGSASADEQCNFEIMPYAKLSSATLGGAPDPLVESDFVRHALGRGLELFASLGVNPFAYGFVASTDTHLGTPGAVDERSFIGHGGAGLTVRDGLPAGLPDRPWFNPGGLTVIWAEENSREALFAAMRRREVYATSGPRIELRLFAGTDLDAGLCDGADLVGAGYARGVPMGGVLRAPLAGPPRLLISALRDAGTAAAPGAALERIQIVKGSLVAGQASFRVIDVAGSAGVGGVDPGTCAPLVGGADALCNVWIDDDFDPAVPAFYYARVLEVPSCRWQTYACVAAAVVCDDPATVGAGFEGCCDQPATQQERAWSSPVWYLP